MEWGRSGGARPAPGTRAVAVASSPVDPRVRIAALAAAGGLAYWMRDFAVARAAYEERLALVEETGDPILIADAQYDLGFIGMVSQDDAMLRAHEERALELYTAAGREDGAVLAREALVLPLFLGGEYARACELETLNLDVFRRSGSPMQIASASTLLSAIEWRESRHRPRSGHDGSTVWSVGSFRRRSGQREGHGGGPASSSGRAHSQWS